MNFFKKSAVLLLFFDSNTAFYLGIRDSIPNKVCALSDKMRILQITQPSVQEKHKVQVTDFYCWGIRLIKNI